MKKKLAIISANEDQLPLVNKAKEMGIETHCFSWDKTKEHTVCKGIADYFHPISILEKEQILEKCKEINVDGVTSICSDISVPTVAFVAQGMGSIGNSYEDMLITSEKFTMYQAFRHHGVSLPRFAIAKENIDLTGFRYPLIVKPVDRCISIGVIKVEREDELRAAVQQAQDCSYRKEAVVSEFITGFELSVDTISYNGNHYIMAIKEREMIIEDHAPKKIAGHYPFELPTEIQAKIITETHKILDSINYKYGASNTEFRLADDGEVYALEVNPRMAGDESHILMKLHNGYDVVKGVIDVALNQFETPEFTEKKYSGIYYCRENTEWIKQAIENRENDPDIVEAAFYGEDQIHHGRIGYFIYQSAQKRRWK